jgi:hypothetical protein
MKGGRIRSRRHLKSYLLSKVTINHTTGCWECKSKGYATAYYRGEQYPAHRLSLYVWKGFSLRSELLACHHCDVPRCINPEHLYAGTHQDNMNDKQKRGRMKGIHPKSISKWDDSPRATLVFRTTKKQIERLDKLMKTHGFFHRSSALNYLLRHCETLGYLDTVFPTKT